MMQPNTRYSRITPASLASGEDQEIARVEAGARSLVLARTHAGALALAICEIDRHGKIARVHGDMRLRGAGDRQVRSGGLGRALRVPAPTGEVSVNEVEQTKRAIWVAESANLHRIHARVRGEQLVNEVRALVDALTDGETPSAQGLIAAGLAPLIGAVLTGAFVAVQAMKRAVLACVAIGLRAYLFARK